VQLLDVVNQLRLILPKYTDRFSGTLNVSSITASGETVTVVTTGAHGLVTGQLVTVNDVTTQTPIDGYSKDGLVFTFTTGADHDLTYGWSDHTTVSLTGFTDVAWNSNFTLVDVPNRRSFKVQSTNSDPVLNGSEKLLEIRIDGPNGAYSITVINTTTFTLTAAGVADGSYTGGKLSPSARVAGTVDIERAIEQYTEQGVTDLWGFVAMHDGEVSKDRSTNSDAVATPTTGTAMRLRLIDGFTFFIVVNTSEDIAAQTAVDICRHELLTPILKSVYGARFTTGLSGLTDFRTILTGHAFVSYNQAVYVHAYTFEMSMDITESDAVEPADTRAYHDTDFAQSILGSDDMTVTINHDDEPL
jgi:hypothetical protein